jgi:spermidine dehydrogenase
MTHDISRRDFLGTTSLAIAAGLTPLGQLMAQPAGAYPPALAGLRGSTDEAFKVIHALAREGAKFDLARAVPDDSFDLVVIGAGLAGLTAAYAYHRRRPGASILILDNNDDFGGHARRCEFSINGRQILSYGGSETMVAPETKFKGELADVLASLRIEPKRFEREDVFHRKLYRGLKLAKAVFFDAETFGRDALVKGDPLVVNFDDDPGNPGARPLAAFLADTPLSDAARKSLAELFGETRDPLAGKTEEEKSAILEKISYRRFLLDTVKAPVEVANFFQGRSNDNWGYGIDALPALAAMSDGYPGAKALGLAAKTDEHADEKGPYIHHFPDGNASLARALVRALIPSVAPGSTMEDLVTARFDYGRLDTAGGNIRLRLNSTAVVARNTTDGVEVGYVRNGTLYKTKAGGAVVATYASAIPHLCPEIGKPAADVMASNVKAPLVYSKVLIRNWESFARLGVHRIAAPASFHTTVKLDYPVSMGRYRFPRSPKDPMALHLVHVPGAANQGYDLHTQFRLGRQRLMETSFATYETAIRQDLDRMLGPGGFKAARDIRAITINRWPHGYSYSPSSIDDDVEAMAKAADAMKAKLGNIVFANSDTGWDAYAHTAMQEAVRAIGELTGLTAGEGPAPWYRASAAVKKG